LIRLPVVNPAADAIPVHPNCGRCTALCCNYISTEIDPPTSKKDYDILRWYLIHPGVRVYCEDGTGSWFVQFMSRCRHLRDDNLCGIYDTRPQICRDLDATLCEFALGAGDRFLFTNADEFERWMAERERRLAARRSASAAARIGRSHTNGARSRPKSSASSRPRPRSAGASAGAASATSRRKVRTAR
jgi:Fe-S-cluster containining protein